MVEPDLCALKTCYTLQGTDMSHLRTLGKGKNIIDSIVPAGKGYVSSQEGIYIYIYTYMYPVSFSRFHATIKRGCVLSVFVPSISVAAAGWCHCTGCRVAPVGIPKICQVIGTARFFDEEYTTTLHVIQSELFWYPTHAIHVWWIYLHLPHKLPKFR